MSRTLAALPITSDKGERPERTLRLPVGLSCDISILPAPSLISTQDSPANSRRIRPSPPGAGCGEGAAAGSGAAAGAVAGVAATAAGATGVTAGLGSSRGDSVTGAGAGVGWGWTCFCGGGVLEVNLAQGKAPTRHS